MTTNKIKIELDEEEIKIIEDLNLIQNRIVDLESRNLNQELLESLKTSTIESISNALGVSDILEKRAHSNALEASEEFKKYQKWKEKPIDKRTKTYSPKYLSKNEFDSIIDKSKNMPAYDKDVRKEYLGKDFAERKNILYSEGKPFSVEDGYTGKRINKFDNDRSKTPNIEHINPINKVHNDPIMQQYYTQEERSNYVNSKENTTITRDDINKSKNGKSIEESRKWAEENKERFDLDIEKTNDKLNQAERAKESVLQSKKIKYKAKEQLKIAGNNAIKSGAKAAIGQVLTISTIEIIDEFKENKDADLKSKVLNIKNRILEKCENILETFATHSIGSFIATLTDALLNSIFKIFKNILKFIKTAFHSMIRAFKVLLSKEYTKEEKLIEFRKIMGVTVATLIGIALEETIEKGLISALPFTAPFAGYISPILAGLIVGIGSVLIMHAWEEYKIHFELKHLKKERLKANEKSSSISEIKAHISDAEASESISLTFTVFENTLPLIKSLNNQIEEGIEKIRLKSKSIEQKLKTNKGVVDDTNDLLNLLENI